VGGGGGGGVVVGVGSKFGCCRLSNFVCWVVMSRFNISCDLICWVEPSTRVVFVGANEHVLVVSNWLA